MEQRITRTEHIQNWKSSGLTQRGYAKSNGINPNTFAYWLRREHERSSKTESSGFIELKDSTEDRAGSQKVSMSLYLNLGFVRVEYRREKI